MTVKESHIWETPNLSTYADSSTDTFFPPALPQGLIAYNLFVYFCLPSFKKNGLENLPPLFFVLQPTASPPPRGFLPNGISTRLLSVGRYPALIWQSPMDAMYWLESRISHGKVIIHPAEPGVLCPLRQAERISLSTYL